MHTVIQTDIHTYILTDILTCKQSAPRQAFKAGLGAMEIACSAMEIAATQTLCEDEASLKAGLEGMEIAIDIAAQGSLSLVMHLCLCLLTLPLHQTSMAHTSYY